MTGHFDLPRPKAYRALAEPWQPPKPGCGRDESHAPGERLPLAGQLNVADPEKHPEFAGNVFTIDTRPIQPTVEDSPVEDGSHWHNNGRALYLIGKGMGDGMVEMLKR